jgi:hypothetical protein
MYQGGGVSNLLYLSTLYALELYKIRAGGTTHTTPIGIITPGGFVCKRYTSIYHRCRLVSNKTEQDSIHNIFE